MIKALFISITLLISTQLIGQDKPTFKEVLDVSYYADSINTDAYTKSRCKLDIRYPENTKEFNTVVWFHGGGLKNGNKYFPEALMNADLCIISVNYRLSPKVKAPTYIEDAAAAVAWVFNNIESYGGNSNKIFVSGHSAGGYLALMLGLDKQWLNNFNVDADNIAGMISLSGQTATHFTVREEKGLPKFKTIVDELSPLNKARENAPPLILITGDRNIDSPTRYEENLYLERLMKTVGHTETQLFEIQGFGHNGMHNPGIKLLIKEVERVSEKIDERKKE
ncbi:alpha/beta hydrolase [Polaribacter litorisediminis]|uniref:alpha/beta hydrolase n=1 Tax=Polaribacter litorisediminis TaxID=1908341 RepID=UPI001CC1984C|nr:alpha/beta hydrolase [Polaribacter litorisediminis]UAM99862.1 alpha/beta hydrolase [Polaribacter litorisediminis]